MKIHFRKGERVFCGADFHPLGGTHMSVGNIRKVTCRSCKKIWGKEINERSKNVIK